MNKLKVLELFGGIGACSKALERLGIDYEIVDYVEIDKYAVKSFNAIHNTNFEPQDICKWDKDIEVDLIMHGSPCQDFSLAGKQAGGDKDSGTRSSLMYETIRIVEKLKPKYVIWENVKNLLSKKHRHNFDAYLETMEQLGYKNYYQVLNAKDYGIPQNRERVFTISILGNENYKFPKGKELEKLPIDLIEENADKKYDLTEKNIKHYQREFGSKGKELNLYEPIPTLTASMGTGGGNIPYFTFPQKQELKLKLKDMLEDEVDEKYYLSEDKIHSISHWKAYQKPFEKVQGRNSIVPTLTARGAGEEHSGMITYSDKLEETTNLQEECLHIKNNTKQGYVKKKYKEFIDENGYIPDMFNPYNKSEIKDIAPTQSTQCGSTTSSATILIKNATKKGYLEAYPGDVVYTNTSTKRGTVQPQSIQTLTTFQDKGVVMNDLRIRKLTPKECFRLMGFDDEDYEKAANVNSNTQLYKQAGNSIVVNVLEEILRNLL